MISFIRGKLCNVFEQSIIIDNNGIGYLVHASTATISNLSGIGDEATVYTYMQVSQDAISLYGFASFEELNMFNLLRTASGIGPKTALSILSIMTPSAIMLAIITDDTVSLSKAHGISKKKAQMLALELRDKIKTHDTTIEQNVGLQQSIKTASSEKQDAIDALIALGYNRSESVKAVMEVALPEMSTEQIIKLGLKKLARA